MRSLPISLSSAVLLLAVHTAFAIDPKRAEEDTAKALLEGGYTFCSDPPSPLPISARRYCGIAEEVPDCIGLKAACGVTPDRSQRTLSPWIPRIAEALLYLLLVGAGAFVGYLVVEAIRKARRDRRLADEAAVSMATPEVLESHIAPTDAEKLLQRADALVAEGKRKQAMEVYLKAALRALNNAGYVQVREDRTNGEYVRGCTDPNARGALLEIVRRVDVAEYGNSAPKQEDVLEVKRHAFGLVRILPPAILLLFGFGCSGAVTGRNDPGGHQLFFDILARQDVAVTPLKMPLAKLNVSDTEFGAVLVDTDEVTLDGEAREHLVEWVKAGGDLILVGSNDYEEFSLSSEFVASATVFFGCDLERVKPCDVFRSITHSGFQKPEDDSRVKVVARIEDSVLSYAQVLSVGEGRVLAIADDELITNIGLAVPGHPTALLTILGEVEPVSIKMAGAADGVTLPTNPLSSFVKSGLLPALMQSLLFVFVLYWAIGKRLSAPRPLKEDTRQAFSEHVIATGALYAKARMERHALSVYTRYVEHRLRRAMPRDVHDVPAFLAQVSGVSRSECEEIWARAKDSSLDEPTQGNELSVLKQLAILYRRTTDPSSVPLASRIINEGSQR